MSHKRYYGKCGWRCHKATLAVWLWRGAGEGPDGPRASGLGSTTFGYPLRLSGPKIKGLTTPVHQHIIFPPPAMSNNLSLYGLQFGLLTALAPTPERRRGYVMWTCRCECGAEVAIRSDHLTSGKRRHCSWRIHGRAPKPPSLQQLEHLTYISWRGMHRRCNSVEKKKNRTYVSRGITVCERWASFELFFIDMGRRPGSAWSIDRIDNEKGYEPINCRWATTKQQNRNKRNNIFVQYLGKKILLRELCQQLNLQYSVIYSRHVVMKWPLEKALTTPVKRKLTNAAPGTIDCR